MLNITIPTKLARNRHLGPTPGHQIGLRGGALQNIAVKRLRTLDLILSSAIYLLGDLGQIN